jgi:hypothetical protein
MLPGRKIGTIRDCSKPRMNFSTLRPCHTRGSALPKSSRFSKGSRSIPAVATASGLRLVKNWQIRTTVVGSGTASVAQLTCFDPTREWLSIYGIFIEAPNPDTNFRLARYNEIDGIRSWFRFIATTGQKHLKTDVDWPNATTMQVQMCGHVSAFIGPDRNNDSKGNG